MNPSPQENQPGEAAQENPIVKEARKMGLLDGPEPQAECHTPPNVIDGEKRYSELEIYQNFQHGRKDRYVLAHRFDAERAKRLKLEGELAWFVDALKSEIETSRRQESELLALRGGEVGQTEPVGAEAKADGASKPTSAAFAQETVKMWMMSTGALVPASGEAKQGDFNPHVLVSVVILGPNVEGAAKDSVQSKSAAPSPEPAAIPKTTEAREWWLEVSSVGYRPYHYDSLEEATAHAAIQNGIVHVREVTGEGRKVSAATMKWLHDQANHHFSLPRQYARELLCVLSEEGGRQKEGGTEIQIPNTLEPKS